MPKKTKAVKKTDRNKAWLRKDKASSYKIETVDLNQTILIVAEGQTETLYFKSFPVYALTVKTVNLEGQSKLKLIESTEAIVNTADTEYDEVWCVFDMDIHHGEKEFSDFDNAIRSGNRKGYNIAYSNDCFELWFYLHYEFTDQQNHRTYYYEKLGALWNCNYRKEGKKYGFCSNTYKRLNSDQNASQEKAIENGKKLFELQKDLEFSRQNPVTMVFQLVEFLNANLRK